jgi:hypothetical protein
MAELGNTKVGTDWIQQWQNRHLIVSVASKISGNRSYATPMRLFSQDLEDSWAYFGRCLRG